MFKKLLFVALMSAQFGAFAQYCSTSLHSVSCTVSGNGYIDDVSISSTSLNNSGSGCNNATDAYTYFSGLSQYTATLTKGSTYSLNVTEGLQSSDISVWIDYNQNQLFEASEWNQVAIGSSVGVASSVSITIPGSAASGLTRMRIRTRNTGFSNGSGDACTSFGSGETEDYDITIVGGGSGTGCISISQYPANTITGPTSNGQTVVITPSTGTTCNYSGEYGVLSLTAGNYTLTSSNPTDYFTVTTTTSTVLFTGSTPLTFSIAAAGTYQSHIFSSSSCVTDNICRGVSITRNGAATTAPTVTTTAVSAVTTTTASTGGNVTSAGSATVTSRGVCYATAANPTTLDATVVSGSGTGSFVSNLNSLTPGTTYHVRAFATSSAGTSYGADESFTTTASATGCIATTLYPQTVTAGPTTNGQTVTIVTDQYAGEYYEINLVAGSFSAGSSVTTDYLTVTSTTNTIIASGVQPVIFSVAAAGTYRVHVFKNAACLTEAVSRTTTMTKLGIPTVTTTAASAITAGSATTGGNVTSAGTGTVTTRGVCYATTANPTTANSKVASGTGTGAFTANLTGLAMGTTYHFRAYATNASGTAYGADLTFTTTSQALASVTTTAASAITTTTANSGGNVTSIGSSAVTSRGICYATTANPTLANTVVSGGSGAGSFVSNITGLTPNTTYYVRAYATNTSGTAYGTQISFATANPTPPTVTSTAASSISYFSTNAGGSVTAGGSSPVTDRGVCYSTNPSPTIANSKVSGGTGTGVFSVGLTGLSGSTTYHFRAYATNSVGTSYGSDLTFTTLNPCVNSTEAYLTNLAFVDAAVANQYSTYFSTYLTPNAQGLPGLPATVNTNGLNPYNLVNVGLPIRFKVKCYNNKSNGTSIVSGLCKLRTTDPEITISDSTAGLNNVGWHNEAWSTDEFEIWVSNSIINSYTAYVEVLVTEGPNNYYTKCIPIPIKPFSVAVLDVDDDNNPDSNGNNNDQPEYNETVEFLPYINNLSTFSASKVAGFIQNFDYLSNVSIWDNHPGSSGTVYSQGWWNYSFGQPQPIPAGTLNTLPEYDFVYEYTYIPTYRFDLHLMMGAGFDLLNSPNNLTLMRSSIPLTFNPNAPTIPPNGIAALTKNSEVAVYPNPFNNELVVVVKGTSAQTKYQVTNALGMLVQEGFLSGEKSTIDLSQLASGLYTLHVNGQAGIKLSKE